MNTINILWLRRDLRLFDQVALSKALQDKTPLLPLFIFDEDITGELPNDDHRVNYLYTELSKMHGQLAEFGGGILIRKGKPIEVWKELIQEYSIQKVFFNKDFEPYAKQRDASVTTLLTSKGIQFESFLDHIVFEPGTLVKDNGTPYQVYTPFKKKWFKEFNAKMMEEHPCDLTQSQWVKVESFPEMEELGFKASKIPVPEVDFSKVFEYHDLRDLPAKNATTKVGLGLRFGTISNRQLIRDYQSSETYHSELIWREFFIHILAQFPHVVTQSFKPQYDHIKWENNKEHFQAWCEGKTGYPMVDAGMRELNATGFMHNRVRMITASFLCKHLLIDWRWGEVYFAKMLYDFELASNNGNWQWAAGTGCDAAPYFRVFNPYTQREKFDPNYTYVKKWIPELGTADYPRPIVDHKVARERAIARYKQGLDSVK